jgi:choice-of-anchor B domain-containing protein
MNKNYALTVGLLLFINSVLFSQTLCDSSTNMAGIYPCNDYDLMSNVPISVLANTLGNPQGSDIWGWTDPLNNNEYAIVATTNSTAFVNVTDPVNPVFLGRVDTNAGTNFWRDVKVYDNHAFIVADGVGNHGMQVFDLTRLRTEASVNGTYAADAVYPGVGSCHNIVINESEAVAYLVGCSSTNGGGPIFVDISTPSNPVFINDYTAGGYSHDAQVVTYTGPDLDYYDPANGITGRKIYIGSNGNTDKVVMLDVTDKNNVIPINDFSYPQTRYAHQGWFTVDQRYFIMGDEVDEQSFGFNTKTLIFDFLDLDADFDSNSSLTRSYFGPTRAIDHNGYVNGDKFYLANYRAGLRVLDIANISSPVPMTEIGFFDTYPSSNTANFNGAWSVYPYFPSGNIIISDIERGLFVVRKSNTLSVDEFTVENQFSMSPNPAETETILVSGTKYPIKNVSIHNLLGQKVLELNNLNSTEYKLNLNNFKSGIFLVTINNKVTKKLIVK